MNYINIAPNQELSETGYLYEIGSLYAFLQQVTDTRKAKGKRYSLAMLLVLILLAKLGGEDQPSGIAEWVAHRIDQLFEMKVVPKKQAPSHMTYRRVLQNVVQPEEFEGLIAEYHQSRLEVREDLLLSMDGKAVRGTIRAGEVRGTHLLSIYVPEQGLVLAEASVDRKENEIVVAPELLKEVDLAGKIVVGDAMHAQRQASTQIVAAGGHYAWTIKGNQPRSEWAIQKLFVQEVCNLQKGAPLSPECQQAVKVNKGHGRIETRTLLVSTELNDYLDWPSVAQVFRLERRIWHEKHHGYTRQIIYGLTSLSPQKASPEKLLGLLRDYWGIETGLHYRRDVTLHEDATRLTIGNSGQNMAIFNNLTIGLCVRNGTRNLAKARRLFNAKIDQAFRLIVSANFQTL